MKKIPKLRMNGYVLLLAVEDLFFQIEKVSWILTARIQRDKKQARQPSRGLNAESEVCKTRNYAANCSALPVPDIRIMYIMSNYIVIPHYSLR